MCPNLPQADGLIGQANYTTGTANSGGVSGATLNGPAGAAASNGTALYLADTGNHRVLAYSRTPSGIAGAASFVIGQPDAQTVTSGTAAVAGSPIKFSSPSRAAVGVSGGASYLAVADSGNNRVLIWKNLPTANTTPNVVLGQPDLNSGDVNHPNVTISASSLDHPTAVAITTAGQLLVVDQGNNRVLIWNSIPTVSGEAASIVLGQGNFQTGAPGIDRFSGTGYVLALNEPSDLWTDGTHLLVSDTVNSRVLFWKAIPNTNNEIADDVVGQPHFAANISQAGAEGMSGPWGVGSDGVNLFVGDTQNNRVLEFAGYLNAPANGTAASEVFGQSNFNSNAYNDSDQNGVPNSSPTQGVLYNPQGVYADGSGGLFVTDSANNRVLHFPVSAGVDGSKPLIPCGS